MKCPQCSFETESEKGFKMHMTMTHKGYSTDELKSAGITPNRRDIARQLAGDASSKDVSGSAPDSEPKIGEGDVQGKRTRRSKQVIDPAIEEAKERILRARCERIASLPYSLMASLTGEPDFKLTHEEKQDLTEAYLTLSKANGWEGTSKLILWGDVMICQASTFARPERRAAMSRLVGMNDATEPEPDKEEPVQ